MIEVRLFGNLQRYATEPKAVPGTAMYLPAEDPKTLGQILHQIGIDPEEVSNVFVNGRLLPRSTYPITLGYPLAVDDLLSGDGYLSVPVRSGDRLGIFPRNMASVVV